MRKYIHLLTFILCIVFILSGCSVSSTNNIANNTVQENTTENITGKQISIDLFVEKFNSTSENKITLTGTFEPQDKTSSHYRTEYRLNAYENASAKTGTLSNQVFDIVDYSTSTGRQNNIRIYTCANNSTDVYNILKSFVYVFDPSVTDDTLKTIIEQIDEYGNKSIYLEEPQITGYISRKNETYDIMLNYSKFIK